MGHSTADCLQGTGAEGRTPPMPPAGLNQHRAAAGAVCEGAEPGPITSARHPRAGAAATGAGGAIDEDSDGAQPGLLGLSDSKEAESDARAHVALASEAPAAPQPQPPPPQQPPSLEELEACRLLLLRLIDVLRHSEEYLELFGVPLEPKFRSSLLSFVLTLAAAGLSAVISFLARR